MAEFQKAAEVKSTPEIAALLQTAEQQLQQSTDEAAVTSASTMSAAAEEDKDYVKAYEVLDNLTPSQRKMVADRLNSLKDRYTQAASAMANDLQRTHTPIKGLADEIGIQRAYDLLGRCYALTNDPSLEDRMMILGQSPERLLFGRKRNTTSIARTEQAPTLVGRTLLRHCSTKGRTRTLYGTK